MRFPVSRQAATPLLAAARRRAHYRHSPEPGRKLEAGIRCQLAGAELQASGSRFDDAANANRLGGHGLLTLYTTWRAASEWSLLLRLDNALDKRYEPARNDGTPGRSWFAALRDGIR